MERATGATTADAGFWVEFFGERKRVSENFLTGGVLWPLVGLGSHFFRWCVLKFMRREFERS